MECDICSRKDLAQVGLYCPTCARSAIYPLRLEAVRILSERQQIGKKIEVATTGQGEDVEGQKLNKIWQTEVNKATSAGLRDKIARERSEVSDLKAQVERMREEVSRAKTLVAQRRGHVETLKTQLPPRQHARQERVNNRTTKEISILDAASTKTATFKLSLCVETAKLLRLKRTRERVGDHARDQYFVSGFTVPDLRSINNMLCTELTAAIAAYAHLLVLIAFYLGIQLPAEITVPHRNYPLATIETPLTSYTSMRKVFPGSGSVTSTNSRTTAKQDKRPRPLFIGTDDEKETVSQFAKKDPTAFGFFVEGIALLAWNVSWLCHSQDMVAGTESWSEACKIGRNLYRLLYSAHRPQLAQRKSSTRNDKTGQKREDDQKPDPQMPKFGIRAHSSAHHFLPNSRNATLPKYTVISDSLRKALITEGKDAEWEVLNDDEFDDGAERFDEAVVVKNRKMDGKDFDDARSIMTAQTHKDDMQQINGLKSKGTSGWTKLKSRDGAV
jgi:hypothetical protein